MVHKILTYIFFFFFLNSRDVTFMVGLGQILWWVLGGGLGFDSTVGGGLVVDVVVVLGL